MIVISMVNTELNQQAIQELQNTHASCSVVYYPDIDLRNKTDTEVTVVDLEADGEFQKLSDPEIFSAYLIEKGLSHSVKTINLLVSDVSLEHSLFSYAERLCSAFRKQGKLITVRTTSDLNYALTFVCPPLANKEWLVYGIDFSDYEKDFTAEPETKNHRNLKFYKTYAAKKLLWHGNHPNLWYGGSQRTIRPENLIV